MSDFFDVKQTDDWSREHGHCRGLDVQLNWRVRCRSDERAAAPNNMLTNLPNIHQAFDENVFLEHLTQRCYLGGGEIFFLPEISVPQPAE